MKRILYVHHCSTLGGAPLSMLYLIEQLDRTKYDPQVLFIGGEGSAVDLYRERNISTSVRSDISIFPHSMNAWLPLRSLRPWDMFSYGARIPESARKMYLYLKAYPVDLIHINTSLQIPTALGARKAGVPIVWHIREPLHPGYLGLRRYFVRKCIDENSDAIIAISNFDADQLKPNPKIHVIYNFVNFDHFDRQIDPFAFYNSSKIDQERPLVVMLGGVVKTKGAETFIEAASHVRSKHPDVLFLIAGVPPTGRESPSRLRRRIRKTAERVGFVKNTEKTALELIARHNLQDTVRFIGMRSDIPEILAACRMLVWPAAVSHFARPIIEAGAMARPVIASDFPSSREIVQPGQTGLLFPPGNASALADAILRLLDNPDEAARMGEAGYDLARQRYDARVNAAATFEVYEKVLSQYSDKMA